MTERQGRTANRSILLGMTLVIGACAAPMEPTATVLPSSPPPASPTASIRPSAAASPASHAPEAELLPGAEGIAFVRVDATTFGQAYLVDTDGVVRQLTQLDPAVHSGGAQTVKWSPDGEHLALAYGPSITAGLAIVHADGGEAMMIGGGFYAWSPDGSWLAESGMLDVAPPGAMNTLPVSLVDPQTGVAEEIGFGMLLGWHPDGERVLVMRELGANENTPGTLQLVLITVADGSEEELIQHARSATWSPDGSQVAYVAEETGCVGLECQRILVGPAGDATLTQVAFGSDPVWSPDGRRLAYVHPTDDVQRVAMLDLASGERVDVAEAHSPATWSPDGGRIAFSTYSVDLQQSIIRVVDVESGELVAEFPGQSPSWRSSP